MACAHAELENQGAASKLQKQATLAAIASAKRLADTIARHSGYAVVIHNSGHYVFL